MRLVDGGAARRLAEDGALAGGGKDQPEQQLDRGALARAVGPEQAKHLAALDVQIQIVEGANLVAAPEVLVDLGQVFDLDGWSSVAMVEIGTPRLNGLIRRSAEIGLAESEYAMEGAAASSVSGHQGTGFP